jgi:uncharacterized glyoxalase superfamily protein PhnB
MLRVHDIEESIRFYCDVLGFSCAERLEGWACLVKDDVEIMLALPNEHQPFEQPTFTGSLYLRTDDVNKWWLSLNSNVTVVYPLEDFDYGMREFAILDNNGYCLQFGQPLPA